VHVPLNSGWRIKRQAAPGAAVEPEFSGAHQPGYDDSSWIPIQLPHTWDAIPNNPFATTHRFRGLCWYRQSSNVPFCFFLISHGLRRVVHSNVTEHPTSQWVVQQLREAFPRMSHPDA